MSILLKVSIILKVFHYNYSITKSYCVFIYLKVNNERPIKRVKSPLFHFKVKHNSCLKSQTNLTLDIYDILVFTPRNLRVCLQDLQYPGVHNNLLFKGSDNRKICYWNVTRIVLLPFYFFLMDIHRYFGLLDSSWHLQLFLSWTSNSVRPYHGFR